MTNVTFLSILFFINIVYVKNTEFNFIWPNKDRFQLTSIYQMTDIKLLLENHSKFNNKSVYGFFNAYFLRKKDKQFSLIGPNNCFS